MMTKLREFSKIFIIIIALSFVGLMVFEWGMGGFGGSAQNIVGSVNGKELTYTMFSELYQDMYEQERTRSGKSDFTEEDLQSLKNQVWERFIQQTLFQQEMDKLNITVSDSEVVYQIYNYPLEDFKQHPSFQTDGVFDIKKYHASFGSPQIPWRQIEDLYRQQVPFIKLQNVITSTARVTDQEITDEFVKKNLKAKIEYLGVPVRKFNSPSIKLGENELQDYYNENKDDFKQNEKRKLAYVIYPIETTADDTTRLMEEFKHIQERFAGGDDFNQLAKEYSEDPSASTNSGDLGYFERGAMVTPFSDAAFAAKVGDIVGPVKTSFGMHLIRVEDKKKEDGKEKVKASHILMKPAPAPSRVEDIGGRARFFAEDARSNGFSIQADNDSLEISETTLFEETGDFVPGIGRNFAVKNFTFSSKLNEVSGVYSVDQGYLVASLIEVQPEGFKPLEEVSRLVENRVKLEKAKVLAKEFTSGLDEKVKSETDFKQIAAADTSKKLDHTASQEITLSGNVPGIGISVPFNSAAFSLEANEISDLVETERGFYYIRLLEKSDFDSTAFSTQKLTLKVQLENQKKQQIFTRWYTQLKEESDIVDNRKMFSL